MHFGRAHTQSAQDALIPLLLLMLILFQFLSRGEVSEDDHTLCVASVDVPMCSHRNYQSVAAETGFSSAATHP